MSLTTPFIGKISISTTNGQTYVDPSSGSSQFAIYDNSGNSPSTQSGWTTINSTCVLATLAGPAGPSRLSLRETGSMVTLDFGFGASVFPVRTFQYSAATFPQPFGALNLVGWSLYGWAAPSTNVVFMGAPAGSMINVGSTISVITPGDFTLNMILEIPGPQSLALDFSGVDLSGEDYRQIVLMNYTNPLPQLSISVSSTWAYANLSNTNFEGNGINNAAFDNAILNATNFRGAELFYVTFNGATGTGPDFSAATLAHVTFAGAQLVAPVFSPLTVFNSSLGTADFSNASLTNTDFSNLNLAGLSFSNGNFTGANFSGASLQGCTFAGATLTNAKFNGASLQNAVFDHATLTNADFSGAQLQGTQFTNTDVTQVTFGSNPQFSADPSNRTSFAGSRISAGFNGYRWVCLDLSNSSFASKPGTITNLNAQGARLCGMDFSSTTFAATAPSTSPTYFADAVLAQANFSNADLTSAVFTGAHCEAESDAGSPFTSAAVFTGANLNDARLDSAFLSGVDFSYALVWGGATFNQATLSETIFANAYLASADFSDLKDKQCAGVVFTGAFLVNTQFRGASLQPGPKGGPVLFEGAFLQGADFTGAIFGAVNLGNAVLAAQAGSVTPGFTANPPGSDPAGFPISYPATTLTAAQTSSGTICADGSSGPCNVAALAPPNPMPASWTQPQY